MLNLIIKSLSSEILGRLLLCAYINWIEKQFFNYLYNALHFFRVLALKNQRRRPLTQHSSFKIQHL